MIPKSVPSGRSAKRVFALDDPEGRDRFSEKIMPKQE